MIFPNFPGYKAIFQKGLVPGAGFFKGRETGTNYGDPGTAGAGLEPGKLTQPNPNFFFTDNPAYECYFGVFVSYIGLRDCLSITFIWQAKCKGKAWILGPKAGLIKLERTPSFALGLSLIHI